MNIAFTLLFSSILALCSPNLLADVVTLKNGSQISGRATGTIREIQVGAPEGLRTFPIEQVQSVRFGSDDSSAASPGGSNSVSNPGVTLPSGTAIIVRLIDAVDSKTGDTNREYAASLDEPIAVSGINVVPAKVKAVLKVSEIKQAGRLKGSTTLSLALIAIIVNGQRIGLETGDWSSSSGGKGKTTMRNTGIGTAAGCGIGAAAAGAIGCGVGGAIGGASGVATSVLMGKSVKIPSETRLAFTLSTPVSLPDTAGLSQTQRARSGTKDPDDPGAPYLKRPCGVDVCPDSLNLRSGASVTGNWLSADEERVQFLTAEKPQTYLKSDLLAVTFGGSATNPAVNTSGPVVPREGEAAVTSATVRSKAPSLGAPVAAFAPIAPPPPPDVPPPPIPAPQSASGAEPEWIGAVYFQDESGNFVPLERRSSTYLPMGAETGSGPTQPYRDAYAIDGARSPVRLKTGQKMVFVVRLANGVDPRVFNLFPMMVRKGDRGTELDSKKKAAVTVLLNLTRAGASSYAFTPDTNLRAGEYAFSPKGSNDAYCFGVDP